MSEPTIIAIAGPGSNSGKTGLACRLIRHFAERGPVGAVKIATATPDHRCARTNLPCDCLRFEGRMRLLTDPAYINKTGKDTAAMAAAGATAVWWLQTTSDVSEDSARFLHEEIRRQVGPPVWIVEGSGLIRTGLADHKVVVARAGDENPKESWFSLLPMADVIAVSHAADIREGVRDAAIPEGVPTVDFSGTGDVDGDVADQLLRLISSP